MSKTPGSILRGQRYVPPIFPPLPSYLLIKPPKQYILPKMPRKMNRRQKLAPGQEAAVRVCLKSVRNPSFNIVLPQPQSISTTVLDLKRALLEHIDASEDQLRLLYKKKPCSDFKTIKDLVPAEERDVEFSVMVMGGGAGGGGTDGTAAAVVATTSSQSTKPDEIGKGETSSTTAMKQITNDAQDLLHADGFWQDLKSFLHDRLNDEREADQILQTFRSAWTSSRHS